jgi:ribonuclease Z
MKKEIFFLGTGCMQPTEQRNHIGTLLNYHDELLLFDCGEGIQRQCKIAHIKLTKIKKIFISHWHGDHVLGLPGLLSSIAAELESPNLKIFGPPGTKSNIKALVSIFGKKMLPECDIVEARTGTIIETDDYHITVQPLKHSTPCIGFRFDEKERKKFKPGLLKKYGLTPGPLLGTLQRNKSITIKGKKITLDDVTYRIAGKTVTYITDTRPCAAVNTLAKDADVLIIESTYSEEMEDKAEEYFHLTTKEAALIASQNNVKKLVLTHISQRYKYPKELENEAKQYFDNIIVAEDFMRIKF